MNIEELEDKHGDIPLEPLNVNMNIFIKLLKKSVLNM